MPFHYLPAPATGPLRQGEILAPVFEHRAIHSAGPAADGAPVDVRGIQHPLALILTCDCDLEQDHNERARVSKLVAFEEVEDEVNYSRHVVRHVLLCDLFPESDIRQQIAQGSDIWKRIKGNQDERYHRLPEAVVLETGDPLPEMFLDFKVTFACHPTALYAGVHESAIRRRARIPDVYLHDLVHRYFAFVSRVSLP